MRIPNRIVTRDTFVPSVPVPDDGGTPPPAGGDGTIVDPDSGTIGGGSIPVVYFHDLSVGATTWDWSFETTGGTVLGTSSVRHPTFTFSGPGSYTVSLTTDAEVTPKIRTVTVV